MDPVSTAHGPVVYVCLCNGITERSIREAASSGVRSVDELAMRTGCGSGCGSCVELAQQILDQSHQALPLPVYAAAA